MSHQTEGWSVEGYVTWIKGIQYGRIHHMKQKDKVWKDTSHKKEGYSTEGYIIWNLRMLSGRIHHTEQKNKVWKVTSHEREGYITWHRRIAQSDVTWNSKIQGYKISTPMPSSNYYITMIFLPNFPTPIRTVHIHFIHLKHLKILIREVLIMIQFSHFQQGLCKQGKSGWFQGPWVNSGTQGVRITQICEQLWASGMLPASSLPDVSPGSHETHVLMKHFSKIAICSSAPCNFCHLTLQLLFYRAVQAHMEKVSYRLCFLSLASV